MENGLYDQVLNVLLKRQIEASASVCQYDNLDCSDSNKYLTQYMEKVILSALGKVEADKGLVADKDKKANILAKQIRICNEIISVLSSNAICEINSFQVSSEAKRLLQVASQLQQDRLTIPDTPLALGALLTGARHDPSLVSQLQKEILSADRIDILCSFIKWTGVRILDKFMETFTSRKDTRLRVITTSYMGATDIKAIEYLMALPNTQVKASYDTKRTRLHAKAYMFHRNSKFGCAYIGSSNISNAALTDGLEWNLKISQYEQSYQWEKISATFEAYWNDKEFKSIDSAEEIGVLKRNLAKESGNVNMDSYVIPGFNIEPYEHQREILERLVVEREIEGRKKHLIVAATGTGKTIISALDYKQWRESRKAEGDKREPRLLFVAHREEILKQSLVVFRNILRDQNFGELMVGGSIPEQKDQLFISIQTYHSQKLSSVIEAEHYEYVIVDEFHHAEADTYKYLLNHISPKCLLGLTATPERADGKSVLEYFDNHISAEIRLPDAINRKLLCPFQYFGITDSVDYSGLNWQRGGYVKSDLVNIYTSNDIRSALIIEKTCKTVSDIKQVVGLGFCVSQEHARYMSEKFNESGILSDYLTAESDNEHRRRIKSRLINKEINFIFVVDLYNEGVDIPEVNTVLFLRPTESLTVFLQQLGRGLRLCEGKDCLTVLDFIGQSHRKYRFDLKLNAILSGNFGSLKNEIENYFPHLPAGCNIQLEKQASKYILDNIKAAILHSKPQIVQSIACFERDTGKKLTLANFIEHHRLKLDDIYKRSLWNRLCIEAGVRENVVIPNEEKLVKGLRRIQHIDDIEYIDRVRTWLTSENICIDSLSLRDRRYLTMCYYSLLKNQDGVLSLEDSLDKFRCNHIVVDELLGLLKVRREQLANTTLKCDVVNEMALRVHAQYTRDELLAGLGNWTFDNSPDMREGVKYLRESNCDIFLITLIKNEKHYSPSTMYRDYAISENLFHWQSQSGTSDLSPTAQRYISHKKTGHNILLFIREYKTNNGLSCPYYFLGPADYVSHNGSNPVNFIWKLRHKMPAHLLRNTSALVAQ